MEQLFLFYFPGIMKNDSGNGREKERENIGKAKICCSDNNKKKQKYALYSLYK